MKAHYLPQATALAAALALVGCGGGGGGGSHVTAGGAGILGIIQVPGISSAVTYSFDLGVVDPATGRYYVTDRTNKSIDVVDTNVNTNINSSMFITQFKPGFAGCNTASGTPVPTCGSGTNNDASGPDGIDVVGQNLYVGDVNALWILDKTTGATVKKISIPSTPSFLRADEGCFDADDNLYGISTPAAEHPFMTFVDTVTQAVVATVVMDDSSGGASAGLEACVYDHGTRKFFVNNDGSTANPRGETDGIPASVIAAARPGPVTLNFATIPGTSAYPLGACDPTGLAKGPGTDLGVMCRQGNVGETLTFMILNATNGSVLANLNIGGGDQATYDSVSNRYFLADNRWTATGKSCAGGTAGTCPLTPVVGVVDAATRAIIGTLPNGANAHSIAVSGTNKKVVTPFTAPTATGGGDGFPDGGISLFTTM